MRSKSKYIPLSCTADWIKMLQDPSPVLKTQYDITLSFPEINQLNVLMSFKAITIFFLKSPGY